MNRILIYSPHDTPRLRYVLDLFFQQILGNVTWKLTAQLDLFLAAADVAKFNYSATVLPDIPQLLPHGLLSEKGIHPLDVQPQNYQGRMAAFFVCPNDFCKEICYPFDLFSWCFYLVSRYEEYLAFEADAWGRFPATQSIAFQQDFLQRPIVNEWVWDWATQLQVFYPALTFKPRPYGFTPSYDIDHAFAFAYKPLWRQIGAWGRNRWQGDQESLQLRRATRRNPEADPYNVYAYLQQLAQHYQDEPLFFWLLGDYGPHDKNLPYDLPEMHELVRSQTRYGNAGLHPSFASNASLTQLRLEAKRLRKILHHPAERSRQHYLKLHWPTTYQRLLQIGIRHDYSMGYARALGFRASIATPFIWYDLTQETATPLLIHPFAVMDVTLNTYLQLSPAAAIEAVLPLIAHSKAVHGQFIPVWHNSSLCEAWQWKGWRAVYERVLEAGH